MLILAALPIVLTVTPSAALACDLDGVGGMHRFNPFGKFMGFHGSSPPPPPPTKATTPKEETKNKQEKTKTSEPANEETAVKEWERDDGNGPVKAKDKATFT